MIRNLGISAACVILLGSLVWGYKLHGGDVWPSIWAVVLGLAVVVTLVVVSKGYEEFLNYFLFALCGGTLGWVIGILASPSTAEEERVFGEYKTAIMAFISGFAVTKLNDLWRLLTDDKDKTPLILHPTVLSRLLLFFGMFFLLVAQQYNIRQSHVGAVIVSAAVTPPSALAGQTKATVAVRPGASIMLKGAAEAPDMDVDWSVNPDSAFAKAVALSNATISVPDAATLANGGVKDGDKLEAVATSRWNHAKSATLDIVVHMEQVAVTPASAPQK